MSTVEPTRERVEAYEKALGCWWANKGTRQSICRAHNEFNVDLGCPVAVAAARVEAERIAEIEVSR